jgi:hypothetical protein
VRRFADDQVQGEFAWAVRQSHTVTSECVVEGPAGRAVLAVTAGSVIADARNPLRRRAPVTLTDPDGDLTPRSAWDLLAPTGTRMTLSRSIEGFDQIPIGTFFLGDTQIDDSGDQVEINLTGHDLAREVHLNGWIDPYVVTAGTPYPVAIRDIILNRTPPDTATVDLSQATTSATTPRIILDGNDPWADLQRLAAAVAHELYIDVDGVYVLRPVPDPDGDPVVWELREGEDSTILDISRRLTDEQTYNVVVVRGEGPANALPRRGYAEDTNPNSATYVGGPFGRRVAPPITTPLVTSTAQANAYAAAELRKILGLAEQVTLSTIPQPQLEPGDVVDVQRRRIGVDMRYIIDSVSVPLEPSGRSVVQCRSRRV